MAVKQLWSSPPQFELPPREILEEFIDNQDPDERGCWIWKGPSQGAFGYGQFRVRFFGSRTAHRLSWMFHNKKPIPNGMVVCHRCDVPQCINPDHLFIGTQAENMADMAEKGRKAIPVLKTHCAKGHEYSESNTAMNQDGSRRCKRCSSDITLAYKAKNLERVRKYQRERAARIRQESKKWQ